MNKHTVCGETLVEFLRTFAALRECLANCGEIIVKVRFHFDHYFYKAKMWSEKKKEDAE